MSGKKLVKWKSFGQKRRFVRLLANPVMGQELASEFVDLGDLVTERGELLLVFKEICEQERSFLTFVLNATQDSLPTPSRLKCWQQESAGDGKCPLGCGYAGTLKHTLCGCEKALEEKPQSRITWRHDSILLAWQRGVVNQVEVATKARRVATPAAPIQFKSHGILHTEKKGGKEVQCPRSVSWKATRE